jgi:hypothetical protein
MRAILTALFLGLLGAMLGAIVGGAIGIGLGFAWTKIFHTTDFEGYSGMLVFFTFMPIGGLIGALLGAIGLGRLALQSRTGQERRGSL